MDLLAAIRPDEWNIWLFLHIAGAATTFGLLATAAYYLFRSRRDSSPALARIGFRTLLLGVIPSYLVFRIAAQILLDKEGLLESEDTWITIGFITTDLGALLIVVGTVASSIASRRPEGTPSRGSAVAAWCCSILLVAYVVALWAMTAKPV
jgi:hypothetical protein